MFKKKPKKEKVYRGSICALEENPYGKAQGIFLSDIYIKEKNGKYINCFNEDEVYELDNGTLRYGDVMIMIRDEQEMDAEQAFWDMFFNKNYCKDRLEATEEYFDNKPSRLTPNLFDRYREVLEMDSKVKPRYNLGVQGKVLKLKIGR